MTAKPESSLTIPAQVEIPRPQKHLSLSAVRMEFYVFPQYVNHVDTLFGGQLMSWIDQAALLSAEKFARRPCVTVGMDAIHFHRPIRKGSLVLIDSQVNFTGRTSLEVGVRVCSEDPYREESLIHCVSAYLTYVALDEDKRPAIIPHGLVSNEIERRRWRHAEERRAQRWREKPEEP